MPESKMDREHLIDLVQELVQQGCGTDSCSISVYADALRFLASEGRCTIEREIGRRVIVRWIGDV